MACNNCQPIKSIPVCTQRIIIGELPPDAALYIFVSNLASGYTYRQPALSDNSGVLKLDLTLPDPSFYNPDSSYELWITGQEPYNPLDKVPIIIDAIEYECLLLSFFPVYDEDDELVSYTEIQLQIL